MSDSSSFNNTHTRVLGETGQLSHPPLALSCGLEAQPVRFLYAASPRAEDDRPPPQGLWCRRMQRFGWASSSAMDVASTLGLLELGVSATKSSWCRGRPPTVRTLVRQKPGMAPDDEG